MLRNIEVSLGHIDTDTDSPDVVSLIGNGKMRLKSMELQDGWP